MVPRIGEAARQGINCCWEYMRSRGRAVTQFATSNLPTHLALVARRFNALGPSQTSDSFLLASYLVESFIKTLGIALIHGLRANAPDIAYRFGYRLVRADGLGEWEAVIRESTTHPVAAFLSIDFRPLVAWATKKRTTVEDDVFRSGYHAALDVLDAAGGHVDWGNKTPSMRDLISVFVQIRNNTKAHGALGPDFFAACNDKYVRATEVVLADCPLLQWEWMQISSPAQQKRRGMRCISESPKYLTEPELEPFSATLSGLHFVTGKAAKPYSCSALVHSDLECRRFFLPNGAWGGTNTAEVLDYASGEKKRIDFSQFSVPPSPLPASETEGLEAIDIQSNVLGNLPAHSRDYVPRPHLQNELIKRLLDKNHTIITLHGRGGMGKTSLALYALHSIASSDAPAFEYIVWFSARDIDLKVGGPVRVRSAVSNLDAVTKTFGRLFSSSTSRETFAAVLADPLVVRAKAILFVFDNFETMHDIVGLHEFLDTHTHLPNKVLITSRERAFKADFPIEVRGMEWKEAEQMLTLQSETLAISGIVKQDTIREIYELTDGHPYVMRVLLGEIAKEGKIIPLKYLLPQRHDIVSAVFERSFERLSNDGRWVFLVVTNWRSVVFEIALVAILSDKGIDIARGCEECVRLSLIIQDFTEGGQPAYSAPELARAFGRKKLEGDADRIAIEECIALVQNFGPLTSISAAGSQGQERVVERFVKWCFSEAVRARSSVKRLDPLLESIARLAPQVWLDVARFRQAFEFPRASIEHALRRAVEEMPTSKEARVMRADYAKTVRDELTRVSSMVSAVEVAPDDLALMTGTAALLIDFLGKHKGDIPQARRGIYLASVRSHMERVAEKLDAISMSRLAWLYLLEGNESRALMYAEQGLQRNSADPNCRKILERLKGTRR